MQSLTMEKMLAALMLSLLPQFYFYSSSSLSVKIESFLVLCALASYITLSEHWNSAFSSVANFVSAQPLLSATLFLFVAVPLKYLQRKLRYARLNSIIMKYGFTHDPATWEDMTVEQAQEVENNLGEWEFPRLWEFAWISDFVRVSLTLDLRSKALNKNTDCYRPWCIPSSYRWWPHDQCRFLYRA